MRMTRAQVRAFFLVAVLVTVSACGPPEFARSGLVPGNGNPGPGGGGGSLISYLKKFFRQTSGGTAAAASTNFKLRGVSIAGIGSHAAVSANFKNKDAQTGLVMGP